MKTKPKNNWPVDVSQAIALQNQLAGKVLSCPLENEPRIISACDVAFIGPIRRQKQLVAGVVVYDSDSGEVIERRAVIDAVRFPYIPGLLSFREAPSVIKAIALVKSDTDVFLIDGQGIAHPRRFGLASHIGVLIGQPTIGCAKSRLTGRAVAELPAEKGSAVELIDKEQIVGVVLRTRSNVKPLYVSVGNKITLPQAVRVVLKCTTKYRLPDPARMAHNYVTAVAKGLIKADKIYGE